MSLFFLQVVRDSPSSRLPAFFWGGGTGSERQPQTPTQHVTCVNKLNGYTLLLNATFVT